MSNKLTDLHSFFVFQTLMVYFLLRLLFHFLLCNILAKISPNLFKSTSVALCVNACVCQHINGSMETMLNLDVAL